MNKLFTAVLIVVSSSFGQNLPVQNAIAKPTLTPGVVIVGASAPNGAPIPVAAVKPAIPSTVRSFKEWKNDKVQVAIKRVTITKAQIEYKRLNKQFLQRTAEPVSGKDVEVERLEALLKNDLYSLEVAQELSVTDYFAIYLTKQENKPEAYKEAAQKMTPDEVGQLIKAYADSMFSSNHNGAPGTKVGPTAMEKSDNIK